MAARALLILELLILAMGPALTVRPLGVMQFSVGLLCLLFGLHWLRILRDLVFERRTQLAGTAASTILAIGIIGILVAGTLRDRHQRRPG